MQGAGLALFIRCTGRVPGKLGGGRSRGPDVIVCASVIRHRRQTKPDGGAFGDSVRE